MTEALSGSKLSEAAHLYVVYKDQYRSGIEIPDLVRQLEESGIKIAGDDPWMTLRSALNGDQTRWVNGGEGRWIAINETRPVGTELSGRALSDAIYPFVQGRYPNDRIFQYEQAKEAMIKAGVRIKGPVTGRTMRSALVGSPDRFEPYPARGRGMWRWKEQALGRFQLGREVENASTYRMGHPLAVKVVEIAKASEIRPGVVRFDYGGSGRRVSILESLIGKRGWLRCSVATLRAIESEDHLVWAGLADDGTPIDQDQARRMLELPAEEGPAQELDSPRLEQLRQLAATTRMDLINRMTARNAQWFEVEVDKLDRWADDRRTGLRSELSDLDAEIKDGRIQPAFNPRKVDFKLDLPDAQRVLVPAVIDLLSSYQIERHIHRERDDGPNRLKKDVTLTPEFRALWDCIKPRTTYRVEFTTDDLVRRAVDALKRMERIETPGIRVTAGRLGIERAGITTTAMSVAEEKIEYGSRAVPDLLAYLQNETELTRSTLVRVLRESGRLGELFNNPQRFMDAVAATLKHELHRLLVDGIKYERIDGPGSGATWEMLLFKNEELINYLSALPVSKSVYEYVVYDSEIEREFAKRLDERDDIKLFVKLPGWFRIDTPLGTYNPDWAILKDDGQAFYLVRETKGTRDFLKLRTSEADKVRCGQAHFAELGVPFAVAVTADEV